MKVLHLETGRNVYGGPQQVLCLLKALPRYGVENVVVCAKGTPFAALVESQDEVPARAVAVGGEFDLPAIWRLRRVIAQERPDLIHIHGRRGADTLGALAGRWARCPMVLSRRVDNPEKPFALRYKYPLFEHVIAISDKIRQVLIGQGIAPEHITVVRDAVDFHTYAQPRDDSWLLEYDLWPDQLLIGMVAQFIDRKGHRFLIEAFARLANKYPDARVVLFGKGPLVDEVRQQVESKGLKEKVVLAGFRDDLPRIMSSLDVLVHPALAEGLGVSLLEASSAGVPVVASAVGGIPEAITHGENGLLVPPGDIEALTSALDRVLGDAYLRSQLAQRGPELMRKYFTPDAMAAGNYEVYCKVLGQQHSAPILPRGQAA